MQLIYIIVVGGFVLTVYIRFFVRIIADNLKYRRDRPNVGKQPFTKAKITVTLKERSGLTSFSAWVFFLNGESIGRIKDGASATAETNQRINELTAKESFGAVSPPLKFFVESGSNAQVAFNGERFTNLQGMNIALPSNEPVRFAKILEGIKRRPLIYWAVLIGYYAAVFFLFGGQIPALILPLLPLIPLNLIGRPAYKSMKNYLCNNYPDAWIGISEDMHCSRWIRNIIFFDSWIDDLEYEELKIQYERILGAYLFFGLAFTGILVYTIAALVNR